MGELRRFRSPWVNVQSDRASLGCGWGIDSRSTRRSSICVGGVFDKKIFSLSQKRSTGSGRQVMKNFLETCLVVVSSVEPADRHFQNLSDFAHQLIVWRVFAALVLIHPGAGGHRINPGQFAKFFLREPGTKAGLFETVSKHSGPFEVLAT